MLDRIRQTGEDRKPPDRTKVFKKTVEVLDLVPKHLVIVLDLVPKHLYTSLKNPGPYIRRYAWGGGA